MRLANLRERLILNPKDAEVIFDRDEPVGTPTDMVLQPRRWLTAPVAASDEFRLTSQT